MTEPAKSKAPAKKSEKPSVATYADHEVITPPNPLRMLIRRLGEHETDDPVARAELALENLSSQFDGWMLAECETLEAARMVVARDGFTRDAVDALFRAAHDIKGDAPTFGYPAAAAAAESLCRILEHTPDVTQVPMELIDHHINAIQAIIREHDRINAADVASVLSERLRGVADDYLLLVNRDRPEHLDAIMSPSLAPHG